MELFSLPLPSSKIIKNILHISDIHIRNGDIESSRYAEYSEVFDNLKEYIASINYRECVAVMTGDVFHIKNHLDSLSVTLFHKLLKNIVEYMPIYIIQGNHDFIKDAIETTSVIKSLLSGNVDSRIALIDREGYYVAGEHENRKLIQSKFTNDGNLIANININGKVVTLFHGDVPKKYSMDLFSASDFLLLGDIHLRQYSESAKRGYAGSLIQQNFGEELFRHGGLLWNIEDGTVAEFNIKSPVGFAYISCTSECEFAVKTTNEYEPLECIAHSLPKALQIKMRGANCTTIARDKLMNILKSLNITATLKTSENTDELLRTLKQNAPSKERDPIDIINANSPAVLIQFIKERASSEDALRSSMCHNWENLIYFPDSLTLQPEMILPESAQRIKERNADILKQYNRYLGICDTKITGVLTLISMRWEWLFCYGSDNSFNFRDEGITVIGGGNDYGKSSFLDIICLALFGDCIESRKTNSHTSSIINNSKHVKKPFVELQFSIDGEEYMIYRSYATKTACTTRKPIDQKLYMRSAENPEEMRLIASLTTDVNNYITNKIGKLSDFLSTTMLTQNMDKEFFTLDSAEQIAFIDKIINIDKLLLFRETINCARLMYQEYESALNSNKATIMRVSKVINFNEDEYANAIEKYKTISAKVNDYVEPESDFEVFDGIELLMLKQSNLQIKIKEFETNVLLYARYTTMHAKLTLHAQLTRNIDECKRKINEINRANYPFNPNCSACQQQFWRLELISERAKLDKYETEIALIDISKCDRTVEFLDRFLRDYVVDKSNYIGWKIELEECNSNIKNANDANIRAKKAEIARKEHSESLETLKRLSKEIASMEERRNINSEQKNIMYQNDEIAQFVHMRLKTIERIIAAIELYKEYLYKEKVLSLLTERTNKILESIISNDKYKLTYEIDVNTERRGGASMNLRWFISNDSGNIPIKSSGGFRKFLYGLIIRIVINTLNGSIINCTQLFLDEGFISADAANLQLMPDFIGSLLNTHKSIILVSHLDTIKECGNRIVEIEKREHNLSRISMADCERKLRINNTLAAPISIPEPTRLTAPAANGKLRCIALTKQGIQCKKNAKPDSDLCAIHFNMSR